MARLTVYVAKSARRELPVARVFRVLVVFVFFLKNVKNACTADVQLYVLRLYIVSYYMYGSSLASTGTTFFLKKPIFLWSLPSESHA